MAGKMHYDKKTGKYVDKGAAPQPALIDENEFNKWLGTKTSMMDMLGKQLIDIYGADHGADINSLMRQIYANGNNRRALRQIERDVRKGVNERTGGNTRKKIDISGKGRTDRDLSKEIQDTRGIDKKGRPVPPKVGPNDRVGTLQNMPFDPAKQVKNTNAAIAAVTDQQIADGAWFAHSKAGNTKITREMRDWAKNYVENSKPKNETKPATAPQTSEVPTPEQQKKADAVPQTPEQQKASAFQDLARSGNAAKAQESVKAKEQNTQVVRDATAYGRFTPRTNEQVGAAEAQEYARKMNAAKANEGKDVRLGNIAATISGRKY